MYLNQSEYSTGVFSWFGGGLAFIASRHLEYTGERGRRLPVNLRKEDLDLLLPACVFHRQDKLAVLRLSTSIIKFWQPHRSVA